MNADKREFLGRGWSFPVQFDRQTSGVVMSEDLEDVRQALFILAATLPGERMFQPLFGVAPPVFDVVDKTALTRVSDLIADTIDMFEPRVELISVTSDVGKALDGVVSFKIDYFIPQVNARDNLVIPFSFVEGTAVFVGGPGEDPVDGT